MGRPTTPKTADFTVSAPVGQTPARTTKPGFSLIELLVTVAIIAVLVAVLLPALSAVRLRMRIIACGAQLKQVGFGLIGYPEDNGGRFFPHAQNPGDVSFSSTKYRLELHRFLPNAKVFFCPSSGNQENKVMIDRFYGPSYTDQFGIDYGIFAGAGTLGWPNPLQNYYIDSLGKVTDPSRQVLAADAAQGPSCWPASWGPPDP